MFVQVTRLVNKLYIFVNCVEADNREREKTVTSTYPFLSAMILPP